MKKVLIVFGTRPEAIKMAPIIHAFSAQPDIKAVTCVTAQHRQMLDQVLAVFGIQPEHDLNVMREDQNLFDVTTNVLTGMRPVLELERPDMVLVQGDTTTAMAGALAAYYLRIPVGHVEAGLRTEDKYNPFPEEMNRIIVDHMSDLCFAPTEQARQNLLRHGIPDARIVLTGNTVIDALMETNDWLRELGTARAIQQGLLAGLPPTLVARWAAPDPRRRMVLVTGHRRESFGPDFEKICLALRHVVECNPQVEIVYPVHLNPRVREPVQRILGDIDRVHLLEPLSYTAFIWLMPRAYLVLTDSGGIQEEAPALGVPVLVMRKTTERPEGIQAGTAALVGVETRDIVSQTQRLLDDEGAYRCMSAARNPYGDGKAAGRIVTSVRDWLEESRG